MSNWKYKFILRNKDNSIIPAKRIFILFLYSFFIFILLVLFLYFYFLRNWKWYRSSTYDTILDNNDISISSVPCGGNDYGQNESSAEQECGVSIPCTRSPGHRTRSQSMATSGYEGRQRKSSFDFPVKISVLFMPVLSIWCCYPKIHCRFLSWEGVSLKCFLNALDKWNGLLNPRLIAISVIVFPFNSMVRACSSRISRWRCMTGIPRSFR